MTNALIALSLLLPYSLVMAQSGPPDPEAAARKIVERMALVRGERVLLVGVPSASLSLVPPLRQALRAAGGVDLGAVAEREPQPAEWTTDFTRELARRSGDAVSQYLQSVDVAVMMPGAAATDPMYQAMQRVLAGGKGRTVHFHWAGAYDLSGTLQPTTPDVAQLYQRVLLETNYSALSAKQSTLETAMRAGAVRVTTPLGTDIRFRIDDRPVTRQDCDVSASRAARARNLIDREVELPAGAVRVAPIEESVDGAIAFPPTVWGGVRVEGLVLTFARGTVTGVRARVGFRTTAMAQAWFDSRSATTRSSAEPLRADTSAGISSSMRR